MPPNSLPLPKEGKKPDEPAKDPAISLIRNKLDSLYEGEPSVKEEEKEIESVGAVSKHQQFIERLMNSGASLVEIQTAWHKYYQILSDAEKREVWHEFYENHERSSKYAAHVKKEKLKEATKEEKTPATLTKPEQPKHIQHQPTKAMSGHFETEANQDSAQTVAGIKTHLLNTVSARGKLNKKHHIQSLLFGIGIGLFVLFIVMFGFFNERFIAPFITPSRNITDTPIIIDPTASNAVGPENKVIIPKINVEVPVVYDVPSINEKQILSALDRGVVHYPISPNPGQNGNVVIVGHSSNNIFNKGKYKFAFVLLSRLQEGDTFMLNYNGQRYIYKIYSKKIVNPNDVSVLGPTEKPATATLITCDPPGTALHRLVVIGEQISPDPAKNSVASTQTSGQQPTIVPGNSESLFQRLFGWIWN